MALFSSIVGLIGVTIATGSTIDVVVNLNNETNNVDPYVFGMNIWSQSDDLNMTGDYTIMRNGGETQSRFNWKINAINQCKDWYWITQENTFTWEEQCDATVNSKADLFMQIPAMGWVAKQDGKCWSFSISKYGNQTGNECSNFPVNTTWCAHDAGSGVWINGSNVVGNNPNDASEQTSSPDAADWVSSIVTKYGSKATIYGIDNEPSLWHTTHRDVHPIGASYDEITTDLLDYGSAIKKACNYECKIAGPSPWGWCGYFTSGKDSQANKNGNGCITGDDRISHNNLTLLQYYLQQASLFETNNSYRVLDYLDIHFYPQAKDVTFNCNETDMNIVNSRLQAPRGLYDHTYIDGSWITQPIMVIPRMKNWINQYYPNTKLSISEYNFGDDMCITSTIAHCEALAIYATYGVSLSTRWSKPTPDSMITNAFKIYLNYDGKGSNIFNSNGDNKNDNQVFAINTTSSNITIATSYSFYNKIMTNLYIYMFNKANDTVKLSIKLNNDGNNNIPFNTKNDINLYGIDGINGLNHIGLVNDTNKLDLYTFIVKMPAWTVRMALIQA